MGYSSRSGALRAARRELGADAVSGKDFTIRQEEDADGSWTWERKADRTAPGAPPADQVATGPGTGSEPSTEPDSPIQDRIRGGASAKALAGAPARPMPGVKVERGDDGFDVDAHKRFLAKLDTKAEAPEV